MLFGSNNIHLFPPLMNDSRNVSNYEPGAALDDKIKKQNNIQIMIMTLFTTKWIQ